jgi:hypothetical protein
MVDVLPNLQAAIEGWLEADARCKRQVEIVDYVPNWT